MSDNYALAKAKARGIVKEYGIYSSKEIDIEAIAFDKGLLVTAGTLEGSDARLICEKDRGIIRINSNISSEGQRRFCVAHELGHFLLHSKKKKKTECSPLSILPGSRNNSLEFEANAFAGELLLPKEIYINEWEENELSLEELENASDRFNTTITATAFRHVEIDIHICALAISENGYLKWFQAGPEFNFRIIETGSKLDATSCAGEFFLSGDSNKVEEEVLATAWLEGDDIDPIWTIKEICIPMPTFNSALSILWMKPGSKMDLEYGEE